MNRTRTPLTTVEENTRYSSAEWETRIQLAACYRSNELGTASGEAARTSGRPATRSFTTASSRQRGGNALKAFRRKAHTICMPPIRSDAMGGMGGTTVIWSSRHGGRLAGKALNI